MLAAYCASIYVYIHDIISVGFVLGHPWPGLVNIASSEESYNNERKLCVRARGTDAVHMFFKAAAVRGSLERWSCDHQLTNALKQRSLAFIASNKVLI